MGVLYACNGAGVLSLSLSLSLTGKEGVCGRALWRKREGERETERERGRERGREGDVEYVQNYLFFKGMTGALAPFSYLVR